MTYNILLCIYKDGELLTMDHHNFMKILKLLMKFQRKLTEILRKLSINLKKILREILINFIKSYLKFPKFY